MKILVLVLAALAALAYTAIAGHTREPVTSSQSVLLPGSPVAVSRDTVSDRDLDPGGGEVTYGVAEYSLDPDGSLYEMHAPHVELPHLGSPKS